MTRPTEIATPSDCTHLIQRRLGAGSNAMVSTVSSARTTHTNVVMASRDPEALLTRFSRSSTSCFTSSRMICASAFLLSSLSKSFSRMLNSSRSFSNASSARGSPPAGAVVSISYLRTFSRYSTVRPFMTGASFGSKARVSTMIDSKVVVSSKRIFCAETWSLHTFTMMKANSKVKAVPMNPNTATRPSVSSPSAWIRALKIAFTTGMTRRTGMPMLMSTMSQRGKARNPSSMR